VDEPVDKAAKQVLINRCILVKCTVILPS